MKSITEILDYNSLLKQDIIPDLIHKFTPISAKRYPPIVYKNKVQDTYSELVCDITKSCLLDNTLSVKKCVKNSEYDTLDSIPINDVISTVENIIDVYNDISKKIGRVIYIDHEVSYNDITLTADLITEKKNGTRTVFVVVCKSTAIKDNVLKSILLQLHITASIMKNVTYIGIILTNHGIIKRASIKRWDYTHLLVEVQKVTIMLSGDTSNFLYLMNTYNVGNHLSVQGGMNNALTKYMKSFGHKESAIQMYLQNPRDGEITQRDSNELRLARKIINKNLLQYFTHASLCMNICATNNDYVIDMIVADIVNTSIVGGKGVVVHTGQLKPWIEKYGNTHSIKKKAMKRQKEIVSSCITKASKILTRKGISPCKILLETPCGEGTEICYKMKEMAKFMNMFSDEEKKSIGLCVDTCHVFASGIQPSEYLLNWNIDVSIDLVHYNDSQHCFGSHKDRHERPGTGHIGLEEMERVAMFCTSKGIPMVYE